MLELAADLRLLDEAADHVGVVAVVVAEDLDGEVAAEVGVAALEDGAHAAAGDLAVDAVADRAVGVVAVRRPDDRPGLLAGSRVAEQHAGDRPDRLGDGVQDARAGRLDAACRRGPADGRRESAAPIRHSGQSPRGASAGSAAPQSGQVRSGLMAKCSSAAR